MNEIQTVTKNVGLQQWTTIIQDCRASGQTVDDYCSANNLSRNAYYYWLRKIKEAMIGQSEGRFTEVKPGFANISIHEPHSSSISICIGDAIIHVTEPTSGDLLQMVIEAVRNVK